MEVENGRMFAWAVITNTDLTEGRGSEVIKHLCKLESTAIRLAHKSYVMGTDSPIRRVTLKKDGSRWYGPVTVVQPTKEDEAKQEKIDKFNAVIDKAKSLGMSEDELKILGCQI